MGIFSDLAKGFVKGLLDMDDEQERSTTELPYHPWREHPNYQEVLNANYQVYWIEGTRKYGEKMRNRIILQRLFDETRALSDEDLMEDIDLLWDTRLHVRAIRDTLITEGGLTESQINEILYIMEEYRNSQLD